MLTFGSLFAGIGGFDSGLEEAGMSCKWQCEIDKNCISVLGRHWPATKIYTDIKELRGDELEPVDLICGGFPCQDLSVAGGRAGLAGERSGLFFEFIRIIAEIPPRWVLIENVPGLLSSEGGRDMGIVLGTMAKLGYGYAYRVLDAQYFGVAQRRRRVFIVGHLGEPWSAPSEVLFESESCEWDTPPGREKRPDITQAFTGCLGKGGPDAAHAQGGFLVPETTGALTSEGASGENSHGHSGFCTNQSVDAGFIVPVVAKSLNTSDQRLDGTVETFVIQDAAMPREKKQNGIGITAGGPCYTLDGHGAHAIAHTLRSEGFDASEDGTGRGTPIVAQLYDMTHADEVIRPVEPGIAPTLNSRMGTGGNQVPVMLEPSYGFKSGQSAQARTLAFQKELTPTLQSDAGGNSIPSILAPEMTVRRLTPLECERLQGFPEGWTEGHSDAARYRMLGNAVCRLVAKWLGERIVEVHKRGGF